MSSRAQLFGVPVDRLTMDQTLDRCRNLVEAGGAAQHVVLNAGKVVMMQDDPGLRRIVGGCDIINADGMSIVWASRLLGTPVPERVAGIDLMERLLELSDQEGWPVYFLGARPEVLPRFVARVRERFPRLRIAGSRDGYFSDARSVADAIARAGARILFVGISSPRKEYFLAEQLPQLGSIFAMGVGGAFDVWAGEARRAPVWMQRIGLEWFFRFLQEPRRMWRRYFFGNIRFAWLVLVARLRAPGRET